MTDLGALEYLKLAIYYASYLYVVAAPLLAWFALKHRGAGRLVAAGLLLAVTCLAYARFVEPRILLTPQTQIDLPGCFARAGAARIAAVSDMHNGLFGNAMPIDRIARKLNDLYPDAVLIAGDFIYFLHPDRFDETFAAFAGVPAPIYAVLGNHDLGLPGPDLSAALTAALPAYGVRFIDDDVATIETATGDVELVGLSDAWALRQNIGNLEKPTALPRIILTHNPSSLKNFTNRSRADLMVAGHTHGGQIRLPVLTCALTGVCGDDGYGLRTAAFGRGDSIEIFTTSGTGMVGLPMRFGVPPRIDLLDIRYRACSTE